MTDHVCDTGCNSTECNWDGGDCISHDCGGYNVCFIEAIRDGFCHKGCYQSNNSYCREMEKKLDCDGCVGFCYEIYNIFKLVII